MIPLSRPILGDAELAAVRRVLESGQLAQGPQVEAFEEHFRRYVGSEHAVAVSNGTDAIVLGLLAAGVGEGDEVIVPSFTFAATANAVRLAGAEPVFADIDPDTYCLDPASVESMITARTGAVMPVHLYGHPASLESLQQICSRHGLALVEDCAQALGSEWSGRQVGAFGAFGSFSFYPTKNITTGEGGMITTNDASIADKARLLRNHGSRTRYTHEIVGTNARMTEISAAIGTVQLERLPEWIKKRITNAEFYNTRLSGSVTIPTVGTSCVHSYHQYTIRVSNRRRMTDVFHAAGIGFGVYYETPCHLQTPYAGSATVLPHTELASEQVVSIPVRPDLTPSELESIADAVIAGSER